MHSECLVEAAGDVALHIELRFLHLLARQVAKSHDDFDPTHSAATRFAPVPSLVVDGQSIESWDEGVERSVDFELTLPAASQAVSVPLPGQQ